MGRFNLKGIFSAPLILATSIRRLRFDGFIGGLVFGAIFSMVVNIITVRVQEVINKQRVLEAIEWEIYNNISDAGNMINNAGVIFKENREPNPYYNSPVYTRDFWEQSIEPMLYIAQLSPEVQTNIVIFYTHTVKGMNNITKSSSAIYQRLLEGCYAVYEDVSDKKMEECKEIFHSQVKSDLDTAKNISDEGFKVLESFHPTQDRLSSWFLKLMMGDKSVRVLSRK